jgi:LCP family protein required for cell wall assembly
VRAGEPSRSDAIVIARANGGLLDISRDTVVEMPGVARDKVNTRFAYGAPLLAVETLEDFRGLSSRNYMVLDFDGTKETLDTLGGVTLNVEEPIETE